MASNPNKDTTRHTHPAYFENPWLVLRPGLTALHVNMGTIIWLALAPAIATIPLFGVLIISLNLLEQPASQGSPWATLIFSMLSVLVYVTLILLSIFTGIGLVMSTLASTNGEKFTWGDSFRKGRKYFWRFTGLIFSLLIVVGAGLVLLIIPGVLLLRRYLLAPFYLIEQDLGVFEAMNRSAEETRETGGVWGLLAALVVLAIPSLIPGVGWILSLALAVVYSCVPAVRYREIRQVIDARSQKARTKETDKAVETALEDVSKTIAETPLKTAKSKASRGVKKPSRKARRNSRP
jgi:hypothetical protein